jgi:hypothetical protein
MQEFIAKYKDQIQGTLSGFDRVVFAGAVRKLDYRQWVPELKVPRATAMEQYLGRHDIQFKDYLAYVKTVSKRVQKAALAPFRQDALPVIHLKSGGTDKDATAREVARQRGIQPGPVCAITATELHPTFQLQNHRGAAVASLRGDVPLPDSSAGRLDVRTDADLVSVPDPGGD